MERKNIHGNLLSSALIRRQLTLLRQRDARLAQILFTTLCQPLIYTPCIGELLLNRMSLDTESRRLANELSELLRYIDLRLLTWQEWYLLYLYDGQQVCLLSLASYSGLNNGNVLLTTK